MRSQQAGTPAAGANFDSVARVYRWAEYIALGPLLQQIRIAHLGKLLGCRCALALGDGDGRFLARLLARNPHLQAVVVDTSAAMLQLLQNRCIRVASHAATRLQVFRQSALETDVPSHTDLVVTHFFLDCLHQTEVETLVAKVTAAVQPGTLWLVSDFAVPAKRFRVVAATYVRVLYATFRVLTGLSVTKLPDPQSALARSGFRLLARKCMLGGLLYSELWVLGSTRGVSPNP